MSSNRLSYDKCAYAKEVEQSTSPLDYQMFKGKYENCKKCAKGDHTNVLDFGTRADVESELRNHSKLNREGEAKLNFSNDRDLPLGHREKLRHR